MGKVYKHGPMELYMRGNGFWAKHKGKESFHILMEMYMMVNGRMIRQMVTVHIIMRMMQSIRGILKTIFNMVKVEKFGKMVQFLKEHIKRERNMEWGIIVGAMVATILEIGQTT